MSIMTVLCSLAKIVQCFCLLNLLQKINSFTEQFYDGIFVEYFQIRSMNMFAPEMSIDCINMYSIGIHHGFTIKAWESMSV